MIRPKQDNQLISSKENASIRILVAHEDPMDLCALNHLLSFEGFNVIPAADTSYFYDLRNNMPDLILVNRGFGNNYIRMVCSQVKTGAETRHIPVIILDTDEDTSQVFHAGADDVLPGPYNIPSLINKVYEWL